MAEVEVTRARRPRRAQFGVGKVLGDTFSIWFRNLLPFLILAVIVQSPIIIYYAAVLSGDLTEEAVGRLLLVGAIGTFLLDFVVTGAIAYGVYRQLSGSRAGIGECIAVGLRRLLPVLGVGILTAIVVFAGTILLVIPGIIFACMLYVAVPVAVVEGPGVISSLKRSASLTSGLKGSIFLIAFLLGLLQSGINRIVDVATGRPETLADVRAAFFVGLAVMVAVGLLQSVAQAVAYYHVRVAKEGIGIEELVKVFD